MQKGHPRSTVRLSDRIMFSFSKPLASLTEPARQRNRLSSFSSILLFLNTPIANVKPLQPKGMQKEKQLLEAPHHLPSFIRGWLVLHDLRRSTYRLLLVVDL